MNEDIISFDALGESLRKCTKGVMWKPSVAHFSLNACEEILKLHRSLCDGTYKPKPTRKLLITHPKRREAVCIAFRDRVYQRSLNDNRLYPAMTKSFIQDNWACQKGKGTDACRERVKDMLRRYYRKHGTQGWVYQFDIRHYYQDMPHKAAEDCFRRKLDSDTYERCVSVLRTQYSGDTGYNPGSQMVQIAGISVLDRMDHAIKEELRQKYYLRYMDDFFSYRAAARSWKTAGAA